MSTNTSPAEAAEPTVVLIDTRVDLTPADPTGYERLQVLVRVRNERAKFNVCGDNGDSARPAEQWHSHELDLLSDDFHSDEYDEYDVPPGPGTRLVDVYLEAPPSLAVRVVAGYSRESDGNNLVGQWTKDALDALDALAALLRISEVDLSSFPYCTGCNVVDINGDGDIEAVTTVLSSHGLIGSETSCCESCAEHQVREVMEDGEELPEGLLDELDRVAPGMAEEFR